MAQVTRDILKSYFRTGAYPTEEQFATLIDSLRHYLDEVPMSKVIGLIEALNSKAEKDIEGYEKKSIVVSATGQTVTASMGNIYRWSSALDTLSVLLSGEDASFAGIVTLLFTTGSDPDISFQSTDGLTIYYQSGVNFAANTSYEVSCLYAVDRWIVAISKLSTTLGG